MDAPVTKSKMRSPNYPGHSLDEAIGRIQTIYESQRQYPSTRETFARLLGYKGLSGASVKILSSLTKYGLLEGSGDNLRVSDIGQDLALHREGDPEYAHAIREAAFRPSFFRELHDQYPDGLPSDHALRAQLKKRGFTDAAITDAVSAYIETMALLKSVDDGEASIDSDHLRGSVKVQKADVAGEHLSESKYPSPNLETGNEGLRKIVLPLRGATWAELSGPFPVSEEAWDLMVSVLQAMKPALTEPLSVSTADTGASNPESPTEEPG